ncbi:hypothetical protein [Peristeroidobacter agariperforans]|nr:hypothetical protein [Peristeroidobacter agariperforans]
MRSSAGVRSLYLYSQGQVVFSGESSALLDHPEVRRAYLGD